MAVRLGQCDWVLFSFSSVEIVHAKCVVAANLGWRP
jgi:hypothetical protein